MLEGQSVLQDVGRCGGHRGVIFRLNGVALLDDWGGERRGGEEEGG